MTVKVEDRPSVDVLIHTTDRMLTECLQKPEVQDEPKSVDNLKLYFKGNEIDNMPDAERNCSHEMSYFEYDYLLRNPIWDPDAEPFHFDGGRVFDGIPLSEQAKRNLIAAEEDRIRHIYNERQQIHNGVARKEGPWIIFGVGDANDGDVSSPSHDVDDSNEEDEDEYAKYGQGPEELIPHSAQALYYLEMERRSGFHHARLEAALGNFLDYLADRHHLPTQGEDAGDLDLAGSWGGLSPEQRERWQHIFQLWLRRSARVIEARRTTEPMKPRSPRKMWMDDMALNTMEEEAHELWSSLDHETRAEYRRAFLVAQEAFPRARRSWEQQLFQALRDDSRVWADELDSLCEHPSWS